VNETDYKLNEELASLRARVVELEKSQTRQKQTEQVLQETQALLASFYNSAPMMMGLVEVFDQDIRHLSDNLAAARFFGWQVEELRGKLASELGVAPQHLQEWLYYYRESERLNQPVRFEYSHQTPQGLVWLAATVSPVADQTTSNAGFSAESLGGDRSTTGLASDPQILAGQTEKPKRFCYIVEDITRRKQIEEQLKASEEKYKLLFQIYPLGIAISDENGKFVEVNPASEQILDRSAAELTNRSVGDIDWQLIRPDGTPLPPEERAAVRALREQRRIAGVEQGLVKADGTVTWLNVTAAPLPLKGYGVAVAYTDITRLKQAEEARRKLAQEQAAQEQMASILESVTDAFFALDHDWKVTYLNQQTEVLLEKKREELLGHNLWEVFPEAVGSTFYRQYHRALQEGMAVTFEEYYPPLASWFEVHAYPSKQEQGGLSIYFQNINERKHTEKMLRRWAEIFEHTSHGLIVTRLGDSRPEMVNPAYLKMHGYASMEELTEQPIEQTVASEEWPKVRRALEEVMEQGYGAFETIKVRKDGSRFPVWAELNVVRDAQGQPDYLIGNLQDITARKQISDQLRESEARFRALFEYAAVGIAQVGLDGSWQLVNERLCQIVGYTRPELLALTFQDITYAIDLQADMGLVQQLLAGERESYSLEKRYIRKDGTLVWIYLMVALVRDREGKPDFFISVVEDINQRKQTEEALRQSEENQRVLAKQLEIRADELEERVQERTRKLEEANRYKSQFLSQMSHELRTPLNSIMGFTTLLLQELPGPLNAEQKYQLGLVKGSAEQLLALISGLLDLARIESGKVTVKIKDFNPYTLIRQLVESVRPLAQNKDLRLGLILEQIENEENPTLHTDETKFKQILLNLLSNAIKFTDSGEVTVRASWLKGEAVREAYDRAIERWLPAVRVKNHGSNSNSLEHVKSNTQLLKVEVIDSGIGIAASKLSQLFEEFGQLEEAGKRRQGGSGLGLAVTRRLAELLGGWLEVKSQPGTGSTFTVYLPISADLTD
jgi:PAS domain S-box-containing protein